MSESHERSDVVARAETPTGGTIVLTASAWSHISAEHPEIAAHLAAVVKTAAEPEVVAPDPRSGRRRHYRSDAGPSRWLRVIVDFNETPARIVTAHAHRKEPPR